MRAVFTIAWKEFRSFLNSPLAYIFLIVFLLYVGLSYFYGSGERGANFWTTSTADLGSYFNLLPQAFVLLIPALAMKLWPDELKSGTIELLLSYPVRSWQVVLGKYLSGLYLIVIALLLTLPVPIIVSGYGALDWGPVIGAYLASILLGGAFLALGLFFGALFKEQVTAFIVTALICGLLVLLGDMMINLFLPKGLHAISNHLSFSSRFSYLGRGVVPLADVAYFVLFAVAFLVLNVTVIECRKGR